MSPEPVGPLAWTGVEELCDRHLEARPSPGWLRQMKKAEGSNAEVREFVERIFRLMRISHFRASDITPQIAWGIGDFVPGFLPGAWGGSIPPFTWEHRHQRIDAWLDASTPSGQGREMLEMGCGFPPLTAIDAATTFPHWRITGADLCFDDYVVYDDRGNYACLDAHGSIRYFHAGSANAADIYRLYQDRPATLRHFSELFARLRPQLPEPAEGRSASVSSEGTRLVHRPWLEYERPNLKLVQAGIGADFEVVDAIRCFNVLIYFDAPFRRQAEDWALRTLRPDGLFLCGADAGRTTEARYSVYRRENGQLEPKEFAFSLDNLRPFTTTPWFVMHDGEREAWMLSRLVGILRSDGGFRRSYDRRMDELLQEKRLLVRDRDGCLAAAPNQLEPSEWVPAREKILNTLENEGFLEAAVAILGKAGFNAWRNHVGHVAVNPATCDLWIRDTLENHP